MRSLFLVLLCCGGCAADDGAAERREVDPAWREDVAVPERAALSPGADGLWWARVGAAMEASRYQSGVESDGSVRLPSPARALQARLRSGGEVVIEDLPTNTGPLRTTLPGWQLSLRTVAWGRERAMFPALLGTPRVGVCDTTGRTDTGGDCLRRAEAGDADFREWWQSDAQGLEQGWEIGALPEGDGPLRITLAVEGMDVRVDGKGQGAAFSGGGAHLDYGALLAWDDTGRVLETWLEPIDGGLQVVVDDRDAVAPVVVDPLLTTAAWVVNGWGAPVWTFGSSVAGAGDVNGDGFGDVIVGAESGTNGQSSEGAAFVYLGSNSGLQENFAWSIESDQAYAYLGNTVAAAGDVNGDGFGDVLVASPGFDNGHSSEGMVSLYLGSAGGVESSPTWTLEGNSTDPSLGEDGAMTSVGDFNGDGYSDFAVGAWTGNSGEGAAFLFFGGTSGPDLTPDYVTEGGAYNANAGASVAGADVNGDGLSDFFVLGDYWMRVVYGQPTGTPTLQQTGIGGYGVGSNVVGVGDTNGDGYEDIALSVSGSSPSMRVYLGSSSGLGTPEWELTRSALASVAPPNDSNSWGEVAAAGDVNGDGFADFAFGQGSFDFEPMDAAGGVRGRALVFLGRPELPSYTPSWSGSGSTNGSSYGGAIASAGDVNGDGLSDLIVGAHGQSSYAGAAFLYYGSPSLPAASATWSATGSQALGDFGYSLASAGDVNGDGYADVVIGAASWDNGESDTGMVFGYHGSATGLSSIAAWQVGTDQSYARFGAAVAGAGDVNGDGFADVAIGADWYDNGSTHEGSAFLYLGSSSGLSTTAAWTGEGDQNNASFGFALGGAGDVNGDGYSDLGVGAYGFDNGESGEGAAFLYLGGQSGLSSAPLWSAEGAQSDAAFGYSLSLSGDINGDGYDDLVVGSQDYDNGENNEGRASLYLGSPTALASTAAWTAEGDQDAASFGRSVTMAGDVDGDGFSDVVVGAHAYNNGEDNEGRAHLYLGSAGGLSTLFSWTAEGNQVDAALGTSVASAGDVNGDGFADLIVGAHTYDNEALEEGQASLFLGSSSGLSATPGWTADGDQGGALFGFAVSSAGDLNGDGFSDLIVGAHLYDNGPGNEGQVRAFLGNTADGTTPVGGSPRAHALQPSSTTPLAAGGRSTSLDTFDIAAFARSPFGRGGVRLQVEAKPLGSPFDATGLVTATTWTDSGLGGVALQQAVTGLTAEQAYHWRARVLYDPADGAPQGWGPWSFGGRSGDALGTHLRTACLGDTDVDGQCDSSDPDDDNDGDPDTTDCDDSSASVHTNATDIPDDDADQDCSGADAAACYLDADGDGAGSSTPRIEADGDCEDDPDDAWVASDCDDLDADRFPTNTEACDGLDNDCDTLVPGDEADTDLDQHLPCAPFVDHGATNSNDAPLLGGGDCDDGDPATFPDAPENCDAIDSDCDLSLVDSFPDFDTDAQPDCIDADDDGDGSPDIADCAPLDATVHPGAVEACDTLDQDCDLSLIDEFSNSDTDGTPDCTDLDDDDDGNLDAADCAPLDAAVHPGAIEVCDGIDNDCVGGADTVDQDGDSYRPIACGDSDCDDTNFAIRPGAVEACDNIDSDCNGSLVDGFADTNADGAPDCMDDDDDGDGAPDAGDCAPLDGSIHPGATESCDTIDQDCDLSLVDGFTDADSDTDPDCTDPDDDNDSDPDTTDCAPADPARSTGATEGCDGIDNDCDGVVPLNEADGDADGATGCAGDCDDGDATAYSGAPELCDGVDNACAGAVDGGELDADGDGFPACAGDCGEGQVSVHPGANEFCLDGVDQDCNGSDLVSADVDGDGYDLCVDDCDDGDEGIHPGAVESCGDGIDDDCALGDAPCGDDDSGDDDSGDDDSGDDDSGDDDSTPGDDDDSMPGDDDSGNDDSGDDDSGDDDSGDDDSGDDDDSTPGDDDDTTPADDDSGDDDATDDRPLLQGGPGCLASHAAPTVPLGFAVTLLPLLLLRRRRPSTGRRPWATLALIGALLPASAVRAGEADDLSFAANDLAETWCSDATQADPERAYKAMEQIWPVQKRISELIDAGGPVYLRYWRARLGLCIGRGELAVADFQAVVTELRGNPTFESIVRDADNKLRRLGRGKRGAAKPPTTTRPATSSPASAPTAATAPGGAPRSATPKATGTPAGPTAEASTPVSGSGPRWSDLSNVSFAGGGGWLLTGDTHYALFAADLSIRFGLSPAHLTVFVEPSIGPPLTDESGATWLVEGKPKRPILTTFGPAFVLRFPAGPLQPEVGVGLGLAINPVRDETAVARYVQTGPTVLVGPLARGGVGIRLGGSPLSLRVLAEGGGLVPFPTVRAFVMLAGGV